MKRAVLAVLFLSLVGALAVVPASADTTLYDNTGPTSKGLHGYFGYTINLPWEIADSFTLASNSTLTSVNFLAWLTAGDAMTNVDWSITEYAFGYAIGGNIYGSETASVTDTYTGTQLYGSEDLDQESFSLPGLSLAAGTYYLQLQNAVTMNGDPVYWDDSDGPSDAAQALGLNDSFAHGLKDDSITPFPGSNSETFQIIGYADTNVTPEPSSFLLLGSGLLGLAGLIRRKLAA
jgi:hypothetical protein